MVTPTTAWTATVMISASRDTTIYQSAINNSAGGAAGVFSGSNGQGSPRRGLIAFDVASNVPAGATVTAAELRMVLGLAANSVNVSIALHRLTADWGEGTAGNTSLPVSGGGSGFAAATGDATWNARFNSSTTPTTWSAAGATGDFISTASATAVVGGSGAVDTSVAWGSTAAFVSDVQSWLNSPRTNYGWLLLNVNEATPQSVRAFYSSEATQNTVGGTLDASRRPLLTVTFVVPEPTTAWLLLIMASLEFFPRQR